MVLNTLRNHISQEGRRIAVLPYESPKLRGEYVLVVKFCGDNHVIAGSATCHDAQVTLQWF